MNAGSCEFPEALQELRESCQRLLELCHACSTQNIEQEQNCILKTVIDSIFSRYSKFQMPYMNCL